MIFLGDATEYSKHLFRVLDTDNDSMVSWKEVMLGFHHLSPNGDPDQKLKIVYSVSTFKTPIFEFWKIKKKTIISLANCSFFKLHLFLIIFCNIICPLCLYVIFSPQMYDIKNDKAVTPEDVKT